MDIIMGSPQIDSIMVLGSLAIIAVPFLLALLTGLLAWMGNRVHSRLDDIGNALESLGKELRAEHNGLERRITRIEDLTDMPRVPTSPEYTFGSKERRRKG